MTVHDTPNEIEAFRMLVIRGRLKLELKGIKFRINTFASVRRQYGFKGNRLSVYNQYEALLREKGYLK